MQRLNHASKTHKVCPSVCPSVCLSKPIRIEHAKDHETNAHRFEKTYNQEVVDNGEYESEVRFNGPISGGGETQSTNENRIFEKTHFSRFSDAGKTILSWTSSATGRKEEEGMPHRGQKNIEH
jgi:hypothetical protein